MATTNNDSWNAFVNPTGTLDFKAYLGWLPDRGDTNLQGRLNVRPNVQRAASTFKQTAAPSTLIAGSPIATGAVIDSPTYNPDKPFSSNTGLTDVSALEAAATKQRFLQQLAASRTPASVGRVVRAITPR